MGNEYINMYIEEDEGCLKKYPYLEDYPFLYEPKPDRGEEYEVTDYSIDIIQKNYPLYQNNDKYELVKCSSHRRQMSKSGAYLKNRKGGIDIVADIITTHDFIADAVDEQQKKDLEVNKRLYHTIGNILPVCEGINTCWGGSDCYWVKLEVLKEHLVEINKARESIEQIIEQGIENIDDKINNIAQSIMYVNDKIVNKHLLGTKSKIMNKGCLKYWIYSDLQGMNWEEFIKQNYLRDFVDNQDDQLPPISLKTLLYQQKSEDNENKRRVRRIVPSEIDKLNRMIIKRGYRIWKQIDDGSVDDKIDVEKIIDTIKENL